MMRRLELFLFCMLVWVVLTGSVQWQSVASGLAVSLAVALLFGGDFAERPGQVLDPRRWYWLLVYTPVFLWEMTKANVDVAYRVLHPKMPIRPGIVKIRTRVRSEAGRVFLANSITLTPGTLSVDLAGDVLYIHWIYVRETDMGKAAEAIIGRFEPLVMKIFD